jgi:hypothetical protein
MFLEVMPDPRDIGGHLHAVRQTNPGYLPQGGIRLLGCGGINPDTDAPFLGAGL